MKDFNIQPDSTYFIDTNVWLYSFIQSQDILLKASKIRANQNFSFWDSIVAASALDCDADYLISEDMQDGFKLENKLTIINPFT